MSAVRPAWGSSSTAAASSSSVTSWEERVDEDRWRSRPGFMSDRERDRALQALPDLDQTGFRQFGGGLP